MRQHSGMQISAVSMLRHVRHSHSITSFVSQYFMDARVLFFYFFFVNFVALRHLKWDFLHSIFSNVCVIQMAVAESRARLEV